MTPTEAMEIAASRGLACFAIPGIIEDDRPAVFYMSQPYKALSPALMDPDWTTRMHAIAGTMAGLRQVAEEREGAQPLDTY